eukprot:COSAG02_NODE_3124_length_7320_cov_12.366154_7_plen_59_part_00
MAQPSRLYSILVNRASHRITPAISYNDYQILWMAFAKVTESVHDRTLPHMIYRHDTND